jgi:hypothetical protein
VCNRLNLNELLVHQVANLCLENEKSADWGAFRRAFD